MNSDFFAHDRFHLPGECAIHPSELRGGTLAALLLLAGKVMVVNHKSSRRRPDVIAALPSHHRAAHSGAYNGGF